MARRLLAMSLVIGVTSLAHGAAVTVREPAYGLPHIFADTDAELARENGREIAKDRLTQLILLARVGRGTLYQAFSLLDPTTLNGDIEARQTAYTSSELNGMFQKLPARERDAILEYCKGVNDTIDAVYAGTLPEPIEVNILRSFLGIGDNLFGNKNNLSDQVDPFYAPPGGEWPNAGFQFTPELAVSIGILEVRNFGLGGFDENTRLGELQALIAKHGVSAGTEIWSDLNFVTDPLAPVSVPDPTTPGYGGPVASLSATPTHLAAVADKYPHYDYVTAMKERAAAHLARAEQAAALGAWPKLGSYAWIIAPGKSSTGYPWLGGFPQTGIQVPSIMHFAENRSTEGSDHRIHGLSMEFAGAPLILIGQTDTVAFTTTTAQLPIVDTFLEQIVSESSDVIHYDDEGTTAPLNVRTEIFEGTIGSTSRRFWRSHDRGGNHGSRAVIDFLGDKEGTADSGTLTTLVDAGMFDASFVSGYVAIVDGQGTGQIRQIGAVPNANTLSVASPWTTAPNNSSVYVAVRPGHQIAAAAVDSAAWLEETTTVLGFAQFQRAESIFDIRAGARIMPTTHNFFGADNLAWNGVGLMSGTAGNIGYWSSGFSRKRQGGEDLRLPLDGTGPSPLAVATGTVASASPNGLTAAGAPFMGQSYAPPSLNFRYHNPTQLGSEFIVIITGGTGYKQTRRIASNTNNGLTIEYDWGVTPAPGDTFEVQEIIAIPEAINPNEGYVSNWNNKAATADPGDGFGREFRHAFILEQLRAENAWDRNKCRQLNKDVAGFDGKGKLGRYLLPRIREAVDRVGNGGNGAVDSVLAALEAHNAPPETGRNFIDPVLATTVAGEVPFMNSLINQLSTAIYGDEYAGALPTPSGGRGFNLVQHAIDSKEGDLPGAYQQAYGGDYFNGKGALDAFLCYQARTTKHTARFTPVAGISLADRIETRLSDATKPKALCSPGGVNGGTTVDPATRLESYRASSSPGQPSHVRQTLVVSDRFGTLSLDTLKPDRLLLPTGVTLDAPASAATSGIADFKCYKVRTTPQTVGLLPGTQLTVASEFDSRTYDVKRPSRLCLAASKDGSAVGNQAQHLMCYRVRRANGQPPHQKVVGRINTANDFGAGQLDTVREDEACVPAFVAGDTLQGWEVTVRDAFSTAATAGIPADGPRPNSNYRHPLVALFPSLVFEPTPQGNRGTYEQIIDVGPTVNGEFMFPLGQSGLITGTIAAVDTIDPNFTSLQPIWRDWRFVPILHVSQDLTGGGSGDADGDGVLDAYERWYFGDTTHAASSDDDGDGLTLLGEYLAGSDPTDADTDDDGVLDGSDAKPQDRKIQ
ncbi:MAG TPA: penicillin acylase family protein [Candidatus Eisenbacteria bacterium]|nr:penicillin acylase family protein [Candidatus Eisenbacteria bacterium]